MHLAGDSMDLLTISIGQWMFGWEVDVLPELFHQEIGETS